MADLDGVREQYHRTLADLHPRRFGIRAQRLWSRRDDVTLANPLGPPVRGWEAVRETSDRAASQVTDGEAFSVERISTYATTDLAYEVDIERFRAKVGGADVAALVSPPCDDHIPT